MFAATFDQPAVEIIKGKKKKTFVRFDSINLAYQL